MFLTDDLCRGKDSPGLLLTKCGTFMCLKALALYFRDLVLERLLLFNQGRCLMLSYQAFAAGLQCVRNALSCGQYPEVPSLPRPGPGLLSVLAAWISGRHRDTFCPLVVRVLIPGSTVTKH